MFVVIMAGGTGTRFWPLSRPERPKQFLQLTGKQSLLYATWERVKPLVSPENILVVGLEEHEALLREHLPNLKEENLLLEPFGRNTAVTIGLALTEVRHRGGGVVAALPADHYIRDEKSFCSVLKAAAQVAEGGRIVTLGITPTRPETGYGYIHRTGLPGHMEEFEVYEAEAFIEKPDFERAREYLASGEYLWNSGIFIFPADLMLDEITDKLPELAAGLAEIEGAPGDASVLERVYRDQESISIDNGVMERTEGIRVIPVELGWSDLGSFASIMEVEQLDSEGNFVQGEVLIEGVEGCVLYGGERLLAVLGVKDLVVVDAGDAVLVCPRERAQEVRGLARRSREREREK